MRLAVMQPYLFPYLGYFKLVATVDRFVFLDDVNFITRGWINRNRLLFGGAVSYFTIPLLAASQNRRICEVMVCEELVWRRKLQAAVAQSYSKAPYYAPVQKLLQAVLAEARGPIADMAKRSVVAVSDYLGLPVDFVWTSATYGNQTLRGEARILDICSREKAAVYCNLPGGATLYDPSAFAGAGVELEILEPRLPAYRQFSRGFHAGLSIIDVLMHNSPEEVKEMLA